MNESNRNENKVNIGHCEYDQPQIASYIEVPYYEIDNFLGVLWLPEIVKWYDINDQFIVDFTSIYQYTR